MLGYFINYVAETRGNTSDALAARFLAGAQGAFALGRFAGVALMKFVRPRWVFFVYLTFCIVFIAPAITQKGNTGMAMLYVTLFFESVCFPTIVALGMRGLGKYSKRGSGFIVGAVSGGAVVPPILGATSDAKGPDGKPRGTALAMVVPLCFFVAAWSYAICVNFVPRYRDPADKFSTTKVGIENVAEPGEESGSSGKEVMAVDPEKGTTTHSDNPEFQRT